MCLGSRAMNYKEGIPPIYNSSILILLCIGFQYIISSWERKKGGFHCFQKIKAESQRAIQGLSFTWEKGTFHFHTWSSTTQQAQSFQITLSRIFSALLLETRDKDWLLVGDLGFHNLLPFPPLQTFLFTHLISPTPKEFKLHIKIADRK